MTGFDAGREVGSREALERFLDIIRTLGPERACREVARSVAAGDKFCPNGRENAAWVLQNITITQPQEIGL